MVQRSILAGPREAVIRSEQGTKKVKFMQVMDGFLMAECGGDATRLSEATDLKLATHTRVTDNVWLIFGCRQAMPVCLTGFFLIFYVFCWTGM